MKDDRLYLHHMLERCQRITRYIRSGRETFMESDELQDAVIRNVEVIGEQPSVFPPNHEVAWHSSIGEASVECATS